MQVSSQQLKQHFAKQTEQALLKVSFSQINFRLDLAKGGVHVSHFTAPYI